MATTLKRSMQSTYSHASHGAGPGHTAAAVAVPVPAGPSSHGGLPNIGDMVNDGGVGTIADLDVFDHDLNFEESLLESVNSLTPLPFGPSPYDFDTSSYTFEDPFAYSSSTAAVARPAYDGLPSAAAGAHHHNAGGNTEPGFLLNIGGVSPSRDADDDDDAVDDKLLGFSAPIPGDARLVDGTTGSLAEASMTAELLGMFFVAEDVFGEGGGSGGGGGGEDTTSTTTAATPAPVATARPQELTCYRRNLWQCSGQITLPRRITQMITCSEPPSQGVPKRHAVQELAASISAVESIEGKPTEIISIPWKSTSTGGGDDGSGGGVGGGNTTKSPAAPPRLPLDLAAGRELDQNRISLPVSWKRLQFKHATANNGRRKGLQQHYVVQINLLAKMENGEFVKIAVIQSGPVIVRGRSPRNFDTRKDVSLSSDKKPDRRAAASAAAADTPVPVPKTEPGVDLGQHFQRFTSLPEGNLQQADWPTPSSYARTHSHPAKRLALSPNPKRPPVPTWSSSSSDPLLKSTSSSTPRSSSSSKTFARHGLTTTHLPIDLSLSEDEHSPNRTKFDPTSPLFPKGMGGAAGSTMNVEDDEEELYEYFPLSLDDWMPPVDAIYRPHVVHHTIVPPELKAQQVRSRTKRYFSSD